MRERGNAILLMLIAIPAMIGVAGLALDYSRGVWVRTQLQKAADSGALAGATRLPNVEYACNDAKKMVIANVDEPDIMTFTPSGGLFTVELGTTIPTYFMSLFGRQNVEISVSATAQTFRPIGVLRGSGFPSAIINPNLNNDPSDDLVMDNYGRPYVINYGPNNTMVVDWANGSAPCPPSVKNEDSSYGWKAWLGLKSDGTFGNAGAQDIKSCIINGFPGTIRIGDVIPMRTGNVTGPPEQGRQELLGNDPISWDDFNPRLHGNSSRIVHVPIVHLIHKNRGDEYTAADYYSGADWDKHNVVVDGFAPFFLLTYDEEEAYGEAMGLGLDKQSRGWMIGFYVPGVITDKYSHSEGGVNNMGLYMPPRLVD